MTNRIFLTLFLFNLSLFAQNLPPSPPDNPQVIPISEITEGMEGVGYTVIHGTNVEPF